MKDSKLSPTEESVSLLLDFINSYVYHRFHTYPSLDRFEYYKRAFPAFSQMVDQVRVLLPERDIPFDLGIHQLLMMDYLKIEPELFFDNPTSPRPERLPRLDAEKFAYFWLGRVVSRILNEFDEQGHFADVMVSRADLLLGTVLKIPDPLRAHSVVREEMLKSEIDPDLSPEFSIIPKDSGTFREYFKMINDENFGPRLCLDDLIDIIDHELEFKYKISDSFLNPKDHHAPNPVPNPNPVLRQTYAISDRKIWDAQISDSTQDFFKRSGFYPNIMLASTPTFARIDLLANNNGGLIKGDGGKVADEFKELSGFHTQVCDLEFCLDETIPLNHFRLIFDTDPDGGLPLPDEDNLETVKTVTQTKRQAG